MVKLGMVGKVLIHNYPYGAYFNGADDERLEARCTKAWMLKFVHGRHPQPVPANSRITHVWAGAPEEAEAIAASCRIENVCSSFEEVLESVDGLLILDEDADFRTESVERCLAAGKPAFVDKVLSLHPEKSAELVALAEQKGVAVAAWSQLLFASEASVFQGRKGGAGLVTFNLSRENVKGYGIHLVSAAFAAFGCEVVHVSRADTGPEGVPSAVLTYADGKNVLLRAGQDVPPGGSACYIGKGAEPVTAQFTDMGAMFDGSAAALAEMFENGTQPLSGAALVWMSEICAILQ